jgi:hypothetical protein
MAEKTKHKVAPIAQMTIKTLGCDPKDAIRQEKQVFMCRIYGEATSAKTKEARSGDAYTYLIGIFRGERPSKSDAEKAEGPVQSYESEKLFLPSSFQEKIESQLTATGKPVQFGYDIYSTPDANVTVGYRYAAAAVVETAASDRLAVMASELLSKPLPGLEPPKEATGKEKAKK